MPSKTPLINKKHIWVVTVMTLLAGLIGASPMIYREVRGRTTSVGDIFAGIVPPQTLDAGTYSYRFSLVFREPIYYMPIVAKTYAFNIQAGIPVYLPNFAHPEMGCNWAGVAGQVFDRNDNPMLGYTVVVSGTLNGNPVSLVGITGSAQVYGPGGYEIQFASSPVASSGTIRAYLLDGDLKQVAESVVLATYADCQSNLLLLNFSLVQ